MLKTANTIAQRLVSLATSGFCVEKTTKEEGQGMQIAVQVGPELFGHQRNDFCYLLDRDSTSQSKASYFSEAQVQRSDG